MKQPTCKSCQFYDSQEGVCRRYPPHNCCFPVVGVNIWCGEHQPISRVTENLT
jgi:hypothetical protein